MLNILPENILDTHFDYIVIGSGFGSAFFLHELLHLRPCRILVLEWGGHNPIDWQIANRANRICCINWLRDSFREFSVVAGADEQTYLSRLQD